VTILFFFAYYITHKIKTNIDSQNLKEEINNTSDNGIEQDRKTGDTINNFDVNLPNRPSDLLNDSNKFKEPLMFI
jgi:hypothetical protein